MKTVVFGAAGFIGHHLSSLLQSKGFEVLACDVVRPNKRLENFLRVDVVDTDEVERALKEASDVVFLAAHPLPDSLVEPKRNLEVNLGGLLTVLDCLRKKGNGKILFASASSVYGNPPPGAVKEENPCLPQTPYAVSKYASEHYLRIFKDLYGLDYVIFRLFNVYGPGQLPKSGALIPRVVDLIMNDKAVQIFGDGSQSRDFIFIDDVAKAFEAALRSNVSGEIVNLGTGKSTSIMEIIELSARMVTKSPRIRKNPPRAGEISNFYADTTKLRSLFGSDDPTNIEVGLAKTYQWLKKVADTET